MNNRVSVIVTCYNHGMYVEQCLRSIFNQTIQEIDLLVINDGSTDDSDNIITSVLGESPFHETHYIKQETRSLLYSDEGNLPKPVPELRLVVA